VIDVALAQLPPDVRVTNQRDELTAAIIESAIEVHRTLGPGLLESVYAKCLAHELSLRSLSVREEVPLPVEYKGIRLETGFRLDLLVEDRVVVEIKCVERLQPVHTAQLLTYLRLSHRRVGLLLNFWTVRLMDGVRRVKR
jgi:GxxExxY protein